MGIEEDARGILRGRDERDRQERIARERTERAVVAQITRIVSPLGPEFAKAARGRKWFGPSEWRFQVVYNYDTSGGGYADHGKADVTVYRDGTVRVTSETAGYGSGAVNPEVVRSSMTRALSYILDGA
ncbi:hypothetical protein [Microbacterium thalassium]|uniref:Uncharacterized protein n=1 Tax=Microbacterium thalassium TaxID=362649 RepID=A0A7X0FN23_9MICO|nr:hypothetical protein [Microbacterium thalassium]MBB6389996.1 hypothetical protein [Microbacterium thalassium]GLK24682.1 hypothetical protein GCM10017607_20000 [Microbacterium thalassium]